MINLFSKEVINAGNGDTGIYQAPCSFIEECGSQLDANLAVIRSIANGLTREQALDKFNNDQALNFDKRLAAGQVGNKKKRGTNLDNEEIEYREDLW